MMDFMDFIQTNWNDIATVCLAIWGAIKGVISLVGKWGTGGTVVNKDY